jgi:hypothetical protein
MGALVGGFGLFGWSQAPLPHIALVLAAIGLAYAGLFRLAASGKGP